METNILSFSLDPPDTNFIKKKFGFFPDAFVKDL